MNQKDEQTRSSAEDTEISAAAVHIHAMATTIPRPDDAALTALADAIANVERSLADLQDKLHLAENLTARQRNRLIGAKARNYGFITTAWEIAAGNPHFIPSNFTLENMTRTLRALEKARQLTFAAEQLGLLAGDYLLLTSDAASRDALWFYGNLQSQARARVAGAEPLYAELSQFFARRKRRREDAQPTKREQERDLRRLLHGTADGEIFVKHESPHKTDDVHEVVDNVHKHGKHNAEITVKREE